MAIMAAASREFATPGVVRELMAENQRLRDANAALRDAHAAELQDFRDAHDAELNFVHNSLGDRLRQLVDRVSGARRLLWGIYFDARDQVDMRSTLMGRVGAALAPLAALVEPRSQEGAPDATPERDDESGMGDEED